MKEIPLTQGKVALVDDEDFEYLNQWKWLTKTHKLKNKEIRTFYGQRKVRKDEDKDVQYVFLHREVLRLEPFKKCRIYVDHKDRNGLNNQKNNLRVATNQQNRHNSASRCNGHSKYKGVFKKGNNWTSRITLNSKNFYLGTYEQETEAAIAYDRKAEEFFGEFGFLNFPDIKRLPNGRVFKSKIV